METNYLNSYKRTKVEESKIAPNCLEKTYFSCDSITDFLKPKLFIS